jgi:hypothetical protein
MRVVSKGREQQFRVSAVFPAEKANLEAFLFFFFLTMDSLYIFQCFFPVRVLYLLLFLSSLYLYLFSFPSFSLSFPPCLSFSLCLSLSHFFFVPSSSPSLSLIFSLPLSLFLFFLSSSHSLLFLSLFFLSLYLFLFSLLSLSKQRWLSFQKILPFFYVYIEVGSLSDLSILRERENP